jgi:predicted HicB family RNase H-like nuclease
MPKPDDATRAKIDVYAIPLLTLPSVPFAERKHLPKCAAIYFVLNAAGTVLYIGQSINLAVRWAAHHKAAKLREHQAARIAWLVMDDVALLNAVEDACIVYFEPVCNRFYDGRHAGRPVSAAAEFVKFPLRIPKDLMDAIRSKAARSGAPLNTEIVRAIRRDLRLPAPADGKESP